MGQVGRDRRVERERRRLPAPRWGDDRVVGDDVRLPDDSRRDHGPGCGVGDPQRLRVGDLGRATVEERRHRRDQLRQRHAAEDPGLEVVAEAGEDRVRVEATVEDVVEIRDRPEAPRDALELEVRREHAAGAAVPERKVGGVARVEQDLHVDVAGVAGRLLRCAEARRDVRRVVGDRGRGVPLERRAAARLFS